MKPLSATIVIDAAVLVAAARSHRPEPNLLVEHDLRSRRFGG